MERQEFISHAFVIRLWLEEHATAYSGGRWRGHITHADSGRRQYVQSIDDIALFIAPFVTAMGARAGLWTSLLLWIYRVRRQAARLKQIVSRFM